MRRPCLWRDPVTHWGCPRYTTDSYCETHAKEVERQRRADPDLTGRRAPTAQWRRLRRRALARDGRRCRRCAAEGTAKAPLHVHHVNGHSGDNRLENLETLCPSCHLKADRELGIWR